jgi:hypothetical protein
MPETRSDDSVALVDPVHFRLLKLLLSGSTEVARQLGSEMAVIKTAHAARLTISWHSLMALTPETPSGAQVTHESLSSTTPPFVEAARRPLEDVGGAIALRESVGALVARNKLPDEICEHLHRYMRDGSMWVATRLDTSGILRVAIVAVVLKPGEPAFVNMTLEDGVSHRLLRAPVSQSASSVFTLNPTGDYSRVDEQMNQLAANLKRLLDPYWQQRTRRRDTAVAMYCAYLRDVMGMSPLEVYEAALADAPGGTAYKVKLTEAGKRSKVRAYVKAGRAYSEAAPMS